MGAGPSLRRSKLHTLQSRSRPGLVMVADDEPHVRQFLHEILSVPAKPIQQNQDPVSRNLLGDVWSAVPDG